MATIEIEKQDFLALMSMIVSAEVGRVALSAETKSQIKSLLQRMHEAGNGEFEFRAEPIADFVSDDDGRHVRLHPAYFNS